MGLRLHAYIEQVDSVDEGRPNILLADDEPAKRFALAEALHGLEHNLFVAGHGHEVLRLLLKRRYALVLLNLKMAGIDGFEIARLIRGRPASRLTPILFIAADPVGRHDLERGYALGVVDFLSAPLVAPALRAKVRTFLELEQARREIAEARRTPGREGPPLASRH